MRMRHINVWYVFYSEMSYLCVLVGNKLALHLRKKCVRSMRIRQNCVRFADSSENA